MMITNKGDDLKITLQESNIQKVRVFTTDINTYIEKTPKDNVVNISAAELINSKLKSGVIAYVCAKSSADSGFEDGKYDTTNVEYTDIYYKDINESFSNAEDKATKEYSNQLEAIKKDLTSKLNNKAEQNDLSTEVGDRKKADAELKDLIDSKYSEITNGINDKILSKAEKKDLTDETTTRKAKDEELQRQLNNLQDTTSSINTRLNTKAEQSNLANEVYDRKKADEDLQNNISSLQTKVQTDIEDKLYSKIEKETAEIKKSEDSRVTAETQRVTAETQRVNAEKTRESQFSSTKAACETATEKANAAIEQVNAAIESKTNYTKLLSDIWVGTGTDYNAITTKQEGTMYLIDDTETAVSTTAGNGTVEKMWYGTKNDYDRLSTKDDNVLYLLVEEF